jgi:hypothetical protein
VGQKHKTTQNFTINKRILNNFKFKFWEILKEMPREGIVHLTTICNAIIRTEYFPVQWKVAQILMIPKPGKLLQEASSYRPNNEQNLRKTCAEGIAPYTRRKWYPSGPSVWISTETLGDRTTTLSYRNSKRRFIKKTVLLCAVPRHHTSV